MRCCRLQKRKSNNANFNFLKITIMKKVKVFIAMIAVALGGLTIWSCTQDEMENGQVTYRYSAEEIATLRAMAEKYGGFLTLETGQDIFVLRITIPRSR